MGDRRRKLLQAMRRCRAAGLVLLAVAMVAAAPPAARAVDEFATPAKPVPPAGGVLKPAPIRPYIPHVAQPRCPKLVGQTLDVAKQIAAANKIALAPITYRLADGPPGVIVDQAATARRGDNIYLCAVVVAQAWTVVVPKVVGTNVDGVQACARRSELSPAAVAGPPVAAARIRSAAGHQSSPKRRHREPRSTSRR